MFSSQTSNAKFSYNSYTQTITASQRQPRLSTFTIQQLRLSTKSTLKKIESSKRLSATTLKVTLMTGVWVLSLMHYSKHKQKGKLHQSKNFSDNTSCIDRHFQLVILHVSISVNIRLSLSQFWFHIKIQQRNRITSCSVRTVSLRLKMPFQVIL